MTSIVLTAIIVFVATNLDDLIILMLFFSQKGRLGPIYSIILGKYLGFTALVVASLMGFFGGLLIPENWIRLLGVIPLIIGIKSLFDLRKNEQEIQLTNTQQINSKIIYVAGITIANGGDNIGVYLSLFSQVNLPTLIITLVTFYLLVGVWCWLAYRLVSNKIIAKVFVKYGKQFTPFLLMFLGIYILLKP
ncbi:cadmium resistance transporter [Gloeocapsa sp. PCC 73106]|uniref:cadmium resistance transporter n=1 Tax=Gloeocapsa sp. PCC 73106 TaxID=102232 RepID=UPI0002AB9A22|nr:cadmium resistance transporter [Gloeocapsa sp. PCC 73106]ELR98863.1 putative permease, cadmium resistance protein [Gloeocapsa sp. PCC 73106]